MRALLGLAAMGLFLATASVNGASLCNCCASGVTESCSEVCTSAKPASGQCVAIVDYSGEAKIAEGDNPLYDISLRSITFEQAGRQQLESFRKLLEMARRGLEKDRRASKRDFRKHSIDAAAFKANTQRYEDAVVNYYWGLRAYRDRLAAVPRQ
jgi:hypothetical protein